MEAEVTKPSITIAELQNLCRELFELDKKIDAMKALVSVENEKFAMLENKILKCLNEHKMNNFDSELGKVIKTVRTSVKVPKEPDARSAFFQYLKERGEFDDLITVNSQTLNAYYKEQAELAKSEKRFLRIPGLEMPTSNESISMRRTK